MMIEAIKNETDTDGIEVFEISESLDEGCVTLSGLMAEIPGEGAGTRFMESFIAACERHGALGIDLDAFPTKDGSVTGQDILDLIAFYERFGFVSDLKGNIDPEEEYTYQTGFDSYMDECSMTMDF